MGKIGQRPAASRTGFSQSAPQAMLQAVQPIRLRGQALRRVLQPVCQQVKALAQAHMQQLQSKIDELQSMRQTLEKLVRCCRGDERPDCPILQDLAGG